jgi:acyl transferase domain-containing protein
MAIVLNNIANFPIKIEHNPAIATDRKIAILGMSCRLPGGIDTPQAFWQAMVQERDLLGPIPPDRWSVSRFHYEFRNIPVKGKTYVNRGM